VLGFLFFFLFFPFFFFFFFFFFSFLLFFFFSSAATRRTAPEPGTPRVPILVIAIGVLLLVEQSRPYPTPAWLVDAVEGESAQGTNLKHQVSNNFQRRGGCQTKATKAGACSTLREHAGSRPQSNQSAEDMPTASVGHGTARAFIIPHSDFYISPSLLLHDPNMR